MNAGKIKAVLFIIVFLLVVALVCAWVTGGEAPSKETDTNNDPIVIPIAPPDPNKVQPTTAPAAPTPNVPESQQTPGTGDISVPNPTAAPQTTAAPQATEAPANTPAPTGTAAPQPTTAPASGSPIATGSFSSQTGTGLNMRADWSVVVTGANSATVTVDVYAISYSLYLTENDSGLKISLGNQYTSAATTGLSYENNAQKTTLLGTKSFTVDTSKGTVSLPLAVEWHYMGSYGGVEIDVIECGGTVAFG